MTTNMVTPVPQLRADMEEATPALWGLGCVGAAVAVGDPMFGVQGARLDYTADETGLTWCRSQLSAAKQCRKFIVGVWIKPQVASVWAAASQPAILAVHEEIAGEFVAVRMAGSGGGLQLAAGGVTDALAPVAAGVWEFWELRGRVAGAVWIFEVRRDGVDAATVTTALTGTVRVTSVGLGSDLVAGGTDVIDVHADRLWWWSGTHGDPLPDWWSSSPVEGLPGETRITAAVVGPPPITGQLGTGNDTSSQSGVPIMRIIEGEANTIPVTITADVTLDLQTVEIGLAPRGGNPLAFYSAAWAGTAATTRVANLDVGPLETYDPTPNIYEVWAMVAGGAPFLVDGEVIVT